MTRKRKKILAMCSLCLASWASRYSWAAWASRASKHSLAAKSSNPGWRK